MPRPFIRQFLNWRRTILFCGPSRSTRTGILRVDRSLKTLPRGIIFAGTTGSCGDLCAPYPEDFGHDAYLTIFGRVPNEQLPATHPSTSPTAF